MIEAILNPYISNIPWECFDKKLIEENTSKYAKNIEYVLGELGDVPYHIDFNDDVWDFSPFRPDACESMKMNFRRANPCYRDFLKFFIIQKFTERIGIRSAKRRMEAIIISLNSILEVKHIRSISLITTQDILEHIERKAVSERTKSDRLFACAQFFSSVECDFKVPILVDSEVLFLESSILERKHVPQKTPTIPDEYFGLIKEACFSALFNESLPYELRMTAGEILIEGQTGIRPEDLLNLKMSDVKEIKYGNKIFHYLDFETRKPSRSDTYFKKAKCRLNEMCMDVINEMEKLGAVLRHDSPYDFIFVLDSNPHPVRKATFSKLYAKMMMRLLPDECLKAWENIAPQKFGEDKKIYIPTMRQYRVFVCTDLYRKGASLLNIRRSMGHLSAAMNGYYVRQKETWQNDRAEAAKQVIKAVTDEKTVPLGNPAASRMDGIIDKIVDDTKVNVSGSPEEILETLGKKLIIRSKPGGYCIRTGRTCAEDYKTDQTLCAYDECPNIYYFYFNLTTAYDDMKAAEQTWQHAIDSGHKREAEKELYKIVNIARRRIIPMLDELERMLTTSTPEQIEERHPGMAETIRNKDEIRKEAMEWIAKTE